MSPRQLRRDARRRARSNFYAHQEKVKHEVSSLRARTHARTSWGRWIVRKSSTVRCEPARSGSEPNVAQTLRLSKLFLTRSWSFASSLESVAQRRCQLGSSLRESPSPQQHRLHPETHGAGSASRRAEPPVKVGEGGADGVALIFLFFSAVLQSVRCSSSSSSSCRAWQRHMKLLGSFTSHLHFELL